MSHRIKILWIVIGCVFALGIVLAAIGFALGATGSAWIDRKGIHFGANETRATVLSEDVSEPFENIDISLLEADVEVVTASDYGYEFTYKGANEPSAEVRNGTLTISESQDNWTINLFGFWALYDANAVLKVYVPANATLENASLSTASGQTALKGNEISINNLTCRSASGDINLSDLSLKTLSLDVASGDVNMSNIAADSAQLKLFSGWLTYTGAQLGSLELDMASGTVKLDGEVTDLLQLRMTSGNADIVLSGNEEDYNFSFTKLSGDIRVNGRSVDNNSSLPSSTSSGSTTGQGGRIEVDTASGSVNIDFR